MSDDPETEGMLGVLGVLLVYIACVAAFSGCVFAVRCAWEATG